MNAIAEIKRLLGTKEQMKSFVDAVISEMMNNEIEPLTLFAMVSRMEKIFADIKNHPKLKEYCNDIADMYQEKKFSINGITFEKSSRRTFDYSNNSQWRDMNENLKKHEAFLKAIPYEGVANPETGEIIYPPLVKTFTFLKVIEQ